MHLSSSQAFSSSRVLNRSRGVKKRLPTSPTWFSTCPFSQPDAGVQATGSTRSLPIAGSGDYPTAPAAQYFYPNLLGETGDPTIGGGAPRVYFSAFPVNAFPNYKLSTFEYVQ